MERIIAYCGLVCTECEAYVATQAGDLETLERLAQRARDEYGVEDATVETSMCDGCLSEDGRKIGYCATCEIRACAVERGVVNCAHCDDYACDTLQAFLDHVTEAQQTLDGIRAAL